MDPIVAVVLIWLAYLYGIFVGIHGERKRVKRLCADIIDQRPKEKP